MSYSNQAWALLSCRALPLALCVCLSGAAWAAPEPGMLPSLDLAPISHSSGIAAETITPISELTGSPIIEPVAPATTDAAAKSVAPSPSSPSQPALAQPASVQPAEPEQPTLKPKQALNELQPLSSLTQAQPKPGKKPEKALKKAPEKPDSSHSAQTPSKTPDDQPTPRLEQQAERSAPAIQPAVAEAKPAKSRFSFANFGLTNPFQSESAMKPISYSPLPGIAIFPVIKHGNNKAFSDLPLIFAREYALKMEQKVPETKVFHPVYTVDELRIQGMGHVYDQVMKYYLKAGRPEPAAMDYLLKQLGSSGHSVSRVIFVEADLDTGHPDAATSLIDRAKALLTDGTPQQMKYFVRSHLQIFDAEKPDFPMVWSGSWSRTVKNNQFFNVTPSVFADSDSQQAFAKVSSDMSRELLYVTPKEAYMAPQYDTQVQGKLVSGKEPPFPNLTETQPTRNPLTNENKQAIQRILQRQNAISP